MNRWKDFLKYLKKHYVLYLLLVLPILYYIIFCYIPMGGLLMAFQDYNVRDGLLGSEWVGLGVFKKTVQTILYLPHFLSWVMIGGMAILFCYKRRND